MRIEKHVMKALDELDAGDPEAAILQACVALDGAAARAYPTSESVRLRFTSLLRQHAQILELMGLPGLDVEGSRFGRAPAIDWPQSVTQPDVADIIYHVHRCCHAHADEVPGAFELLEQQEGGGLRLGLVDGTVQLPRSVVVGILAVAVLSPASAGLDPLPPGYRLWWHPPAAPDTEWLPMPVGEWWGRETDFLAVALQHPRSYVTADSSTDTWSVTVEPGAGGIMIISHPAYPKQP